MIQLYLITYSIIIILIRLRSKSSSSSAHKNNSTRKKDTKSLENLLDDERPIPRYVHTLSAEKVRERFSRLAKFLIVYS